MMVLKRFGEQEQEDGTEAFWRAGRQLMELERFRGQDDRGWYLNALENRSKKMVLERFGGQEDS